VDNFDEQWKNLWIISGFHKSGYALAPYFGKLLSQNFPENLGAFTHPLVSDGELNIP
jgi:hypothetical protein